MLSFIAILFGLSLIDATSIGTLFIPLWLMLGAGPFRAERLGVYLGTLIGFYFIMGIVLMAGADVVIGAVQGAFAEGGALDTPLVNGLILALGAGLVALSFKKPRPRPGPSRMARWRARTAGVDSIRALAGLALLAGTLEISMMFPYLGAVALISGLDAGWGTRIAVLALYCVLMVLPALVGVIVRMVMGARIEPGLDWLNRQMDRHGGGAVLWMTGLLGAVLVWFGGSRLLGW